MSANLLEAIYLRYQNLRQVALDVYAPKIEEYDNPDYERICMIILFGFDAENEKKVAERLGVSSQQLRSDLTLLATGARLQKQGK